MLGLCLYEDLNDHDELCRDRLPVVRPGRPDGGVPARESDRGKLLAGKSTLNRLERTPLEPEGAYKKIVADPAGMDELLLEVFVEAHPEPPEEVILDVDATDDPLHGKPVLPRLLPLATCRCTFCGEHRCVRGSHADRGAAHGVVAELEPIVRRLREAWPQVRITVRGDSAFSNDEDPGASPITSWGWRRTILDGDREDHRSCAGDGPDEAGNCAIRRTRVGRASRVVAKCGALPRGKNPRFIVTSVPVQECEGRREELRAGRHGESAGSDCGPRRRIRRGQLRSAFAYVMMETLRRVGLAGTKLARAQSWTLRVRLPSGHRSGSQPQGLVVLFRELRMRRC